MTKPSGHSLVIIPTAVNLTESVLGPHTLSEIMTVKNKYFRYNKGATRYP